ncbi:MAG: SAM-dependent methyltransferase [Candidatus Limnocylindrales bacterium]
MNRAEETTAGSPVAGNSTATDSSVDPASFRDPSGFVFWRNGQPYRQVNQVFAADWDAFVASGLRDRLLDRELLIPHEEAPSELSPDGQAWQLQRVEKLEFVSYPYEWTFGELKDAALLTLDLQAAALECGLTLKDASAYNIQFRGCRPILIDTLSFERAEPDAPWIAYRQFCEHFLAPLALMALRDARLGMLLREWLDGVPLDLASSLLPASTWLRPGLAAHVRLHARAQRRYADGGPGTDGTSPGRPRPTMSRQRQEALLRSLRGAVEGLRWDPSGTEWADYATNTSYSERAESAKKRTVEGMLKAAGVTKGGTRPADTRPAGTRVWDLGANVGVYSAIAASVGASVLAFDIDPAAAERHYRRLRADGQAAILPLVQDLANPSPGLGWAGRERRLLADRGPADVVMALALVHHLAIGRNVPLPMLSLFFAELAPAAIVEFVPKEDPMVRRLLASRRDVFPDYTLEGFRRAFATDWDLAEEIPIEDSPRVLFRLVRRA